MTGQRLLVVGIGAALCAASAGIAKGQEYDHRKIVNFDDPTDPGVEPDEVPVNFRVPEPEDDSETYRTLAKLDELLATPGEAEVLMQVDLGATRPDVSGGTNVASRDVIAVECSTPQALRPDGTQKGRAVVLGGIHAREWMAYEGVVRKLQVFQGEAFDENFDDVQERMAAGSRDVFFVENVRALFIPLLNGGGIVVTHRHFNECFMISEDDADTPGDIRDGRLRRKNLLATDGALTPPDETSDPCALNGVDLNRNQLEPTTGSSELASLTFRGAFRGDEDPELVLEPETVALQTGMARTFGDTPATTRLSGAGFVDVHTPADLVFFPGTASSDDQRFARAIRAGSGVEEVRRSGNTGTTKDLADVTFKVPGVTLELPVDPRLREFWGPALDFPLSPVEKDGVEFLPLTYVNTKFLVSNDDYPRQRDVAAGGIDALLDWAAGPPYARELILLQDKAQPGQPAPDGEFDPTLLRGDAEVIFSRRWAATEDDPWQRKASQRVPGVRWANAEGPVRLVVVFSKPMREARTAAEPDVRLVTDSGSVDVQIGDPAADTTRWQAEDLLTPDEGAERTEVITTLGAERYVFDTWIGSFELPDDVTIDDPDGDVAHFRIEATDGVSLTLDGDPATVAAWRDGEFQDSYERDEPDTTHDGLRIDTKPPRLRKP